MTLPSPVLAMPTPAALPHGEVGPAGVAPHSHRERMPPPLVVVVLSALLLLALSAVSLVAGSKDTSLPDVVDVLTGGGDDYLKSVVASRIPRTVLAVLVGAALAVAGMLIQGITRNPLGDPGLLGITVGASAAVVTATAFFGFVGGVGTVWVALPGALLTVFIVYAIGGRGSGSNVVPLILTGAVISAVLGACVQAIILTRPDVFDSFRHWVIGALSGRGFDTIAAVTPVLLVGFILAACLASSLNTLALGDDVATALGARVPLVRGGGILAAALLSAAATAAVGPIAFVGLAVPHIVRSLVGVDHRWQLPVSVLLGGSLLILADIVGRVIVRPEELMVGIVTALVGAPFLLVAVRRGWVAR